MRLRSESLNKDSLVDFNTESLKSNNGVNNNSNSADNDAHEYLNRHTNFSTKGVKHNERIAPIIEKYTQNMEGMAKVIEETKMENESSWDEGKLLFNILYLFTILNWVIKLINTIDEDIKYSPLWNCLRNHMEKSKSTVRISPFGIQNPRICFLGVIPLANL